ncbi:MAG: hypothetical protein ABSB54_19545 [Acidimicrobiales bacterium]|jgi:hypothetical protein
MSLAALAVAALLLGGVIATAAVDSARHTKRVGTGVSVANPLANSSLVASGLTVPLGTTNRQPTPRGPAVVAYAGTGRRVSIADVSDPYGFWQNEFGIAVIGGDAVVVENLSASTKGSNGGTAVAVRPGTNWHESLGAATEVFAGVQIGTVWIWAEYGSSALPPDCTIREVSVDGAVLLQPVRLPCSWAVLGVTHGGVVIAPDQSSSDTVETWDPVTRVGSDRFGFPSASKHGADIANGVAATSDNNFRNHESVQKVFISDLAAARYYEINLRAAPGMAFPWYDADVLSPNGRYLAVEETTLAYDRRQEAAALETGPGPAGACAVVPCAAPVTGLVAVFDVSTGNLVFQRALSFLSSGQVTWSPDGSWLFLTASNRTIAIVPTFSTSAPIRVIVLTRSPAVGSVGSENFVVVGQP